MALYTSRSNTPCVLATWPALGLTLATSGIGKRAMLSLSCPAGTAQSHAGPRLPRPDSRHDRLTAAMAH